MKFLKNSYVKIFGLKNYFITVSKSFFILFRLGLLRSNKNFDCHYFVKTLIKPGDHVIDIGANLGYYTVLFSDLVKTTGQVYAVEPVALYREVLMKNAGSRKNIRLFPFALGEENKDAITMAIPGSDISRHGLTRVLETNTGAQAKTFTVAMRNPLELFADIPRINYIKCDVEGYELHIIPLIMPLILKHHPILQIETEGENKVRIVALLEAAGYKTYFVAGKKLIPLATASSAHAGDLFFISGGQ